MLKIVPVILSGGFGTRLWPLSREMTPKQFNQNIINPSFFERTFSLVQDDIFSKPIIVSNVNHKLLIHDAIASDGNANYDALILEPSSKNTSAAIVAATLFVRKKYGSDARILVLPSDHLIPNKAKFLESVQNAIAPSQNNFVTFGIKPEKPETGYGYIEVDGSNANHIFKIKQFKEKPDKETAIKFIEQGNFYWNAGIFLFNVDFLLKAYQEFALQTLNFVEESLSDAVIENAIIYLSQAFNKIQSNSIDYEILEKIPNICMSEMLSPWSDVGSFESLYAAISHEQNHDKTSSTNVIRGNVQAMETTGCLIQNNTNSLLTVFGMQNTVIVQTQDVTTILPLSCSQDVKKLVENLHDTSKKIESTKVQRPWGKYEVIEEGAGYKIKKITVNPQKSLSLQSHEHRSENWVVVKGSATVTRGCDVIELTVGQSIFIPLKTKHRLQNTTGNAIEIIEVQTGSYLGEDDIVRYQDDYGRA